MNLFIENGKIKTNIHRKSPPIYLNTSSCHDRAVFDGIYKSIGSRLRSICKKDEDFLREVDNYSRYLQIAGHNYKTAKSELLKYLNPEANSKEHGPKRFFSNSFSYNHKSLRNHTKHHTKHEHNKDENVQLHNKDENVQLHRKLYWIATFDPRMPHQRQIINKNYHILQGDKKFKELFPRSSFVSGARRMKNLMELLSPTNPKPIQRDHESHVKDVHENLKQFKCNKCVYKTPREEDLEIHIKDMHVNIKKKKYVNMKKNKCNNWDHIASTKEYLESHVEDVHVSNLEKCVLTDEDIESLRPNRWLTDNVIWQYINPQL